VRAKEEVGEVSEEMYAMSFKRFSIKERSGSSGNSECNRLMALVPSAERDQPSLLVALRRSFSAIDVGVAVGLLVGEDVGLEVGEVDGLLDGLCDGFSDGLADGEVDGLLVGLEVGVGVGSFVILDHFVPVQCGYTVL